MGTPHILRTITRSSRFHEYNSLIYKYNYPASDALELCFAINKGRFVIISVVLEFYCLTVQVQLVLTQKH